MRYSPGLIANCIAMLDSIIYKMQALSLLLQPDDVITRTTLDSVKAHIVEQRMLIINQTVHHWKIAHSLECVLRFMQTFQVEWYPVPTPIQEQGNLDRSPAAGGVGSGGQG